MVLALGSLAQPKGPYKPGDVVHFVLHDATGKSMSLSQFKNKIIVLDFYGYY
jgi:peroxiredoxin